MTASPTEQELAEQLGVARNSVREAIKILVFMGVLEIRRPEGTFVCDGFSESMINPMIYGVILGRNNSYNSLLELREMMETGVLCLAMKKASDAELELLHQDLEKMKVECLRQPPDVESVFTADNEFHNRIDSFCNNLIVTKINSIVRILSSKLRYDTVSKMILTGQGQRLYEAHEQIYIMLTERKQEDLNEKVRNTYFLKELDY